MIATVSGPLVKKHNGDNCTHRDVTGTKLQCSSYSHLYGGGLVCLYTVGPERMGYPALSLASSLETSPEPGARLVASSSCHPPASTLLLLL